MTTPAPFPHDRRIQLRSFSVTVPRGRMLVECHHLDVEAGSIHAVVGPNGSGKTSMLRGMAGIMPSGGSILVNGTDLTNRGLSHRTRVLAYQPQGGLHGEGITAREFVLAGCTAQAGWLGGASREQQERVDRALAATGSAGLAGHGLSTLSGGEAARVALASTLSVGAHWLLLDEPVAAADVAAAREVYRMLRGLVDDGHASILVVEHDLGLARSFADSVTLVDRGRVVVTGPSGAVFADPAMEAAYGCRLAVTEVAPMAFAVTALGTGELVASGVPAPPRPAPRAATTGAKS
jgi:iron complex transport system ATP-binding protein